ncbi:MAG TPA: hypothetical protein PLH29_03690 [bacterium]|nr:hypothetical protein [bacterium]
MFLNYSFFKKSKFLAAVVIGVLVFQTMGVNSVILAEGEEAAEETIGGEYGLAEEDVEDIDSEDGLLSDDIASTAGGASGTTTIATGDVLIDIGVINGENINIASSVCGSCFEGDEISPGHSEIENNNETSTTNDVISEGNTGDNVITDVAGDAVIMTGDIDIFNVIINFINNNFSGNGQAYFINILSQLLDNIDLSGYGEVLNDSEYSYCQIQNCLVAINNSSTSTLANNVVIDANTGGNEISSVGGGAIISTGDINIINDIFNIANLNISGEDWFFAVVNIFGELQGDIILPGWQSEDIGAINDDNVFNPASSSPEVLITNTNSLDMLNEVIVNGASGQNTASGTGAVSILTGNVETKNIIFNLLNYNISGRKWTLAKVNIFGDWQGVIESLPDGYSYFNDGSGITIFNNFRNDPEISEAYARLALMNFNSASILNKIEVNADTGNNAILHANGAGLINTGDISITNALLNFINANFFGDSWEFSMINVFGNWQGNLAFGRPDLWIVESVEPASEAISGDYITYRYLFGNNGDGTASNVVISDDYNEIFLDVDDGLLESDSGMILFRLGSLAPNSQGSISYTVRVRGDIPAGKNEVFNSASISASETDRDYSNNASFSSVLINGGSQPSGSSNYPSIRLTSGESSGYVSPSFSIIKTNSAQEAVSPGDMVDFKIVVKNLGGRSLQDVLVADVMKSLDDNTEINNDLWRLDEVRAGEEIIIDYTIEIKNNIASGEYINEAIVEGYDDIRQVYISAVASSKIRVNNGADVLSAVAAPQLTIGKIIRSGALEPGKIITNEIIIANNGNLTAFNVKIIESLSRNLAFANSKSSIEEWDIGDLPPGGIKTIRYDYEIQAAAKRGVFTCATVVKADNHDPVIKNLDFSLAESKQAGSLNTRSIYPLIGNSIADLSDQAIKIEGGNYRQKIIKEALAANNDNNYVVDKLYSNLIILGNLLLIFLVIASIYFIIQYLKEKKKLNK